MNKWVAMRDGAPKPRRPRPRPNLASSVEHLRDAEKFRRQVVKAMREQIAAIQNPALPENQVREINDEINRLQREKYHWNKRVHELGGEDHNALERKRQIEEGDTQLHMSYRYYGVAKELPGVKEHIEKELQARKKVKKTDIHKRISPDYYGWRDEDDGVLLEVERKADEGSRPTLTKLPDEDFLDVPSQEEIAEILLREKKKALLAKYAL